MFNNYQKNQSIQLPKIKCKDECSLFQIQFLFLNQQRNQSETEKRKQNDEIKQKNNELIDDQQEYIKSEANQLNYYQKNQVSLKDQQQNQLSIQKNRKKNQIRKEKKESKKIIAMQSSDLSQSSINTQPSVQNQTRKSSSDSSGQNSKNFNIQLCGNSSVGKTSIIHRLIYDNYLENTVITLGVNYYKKSFSIQGDQISVTIHDTSGQERYIDITKQSVRKADALILVYDKTSEQSFQDLESLWISQFDKIVDLTSIPLLLIGNKSDLYSQRRSEQVSYDQADQFARQYNMAFFETSALSGHQIQTAFESLVQRLYLSRKQKNNPPVSIQKKKKTYPYSKQSCC